MREVYRFRELLDELSEVLKLARYAHTRYVASTNAHFDTLYTTPYDRRRDDRRACKQQLREINSAARRGYSLQEMEDEACESDISDITLQRWMEFVEQEAQLTRLRHQLAELATVPERYRDSYKLQVDLHDTHFYFGGTNGSSGDDGHGHYVVSNDSGLLTYRREPFKEHGFQNVVIVGSYENTSITPLLNRR